MQYQTLPQLNEKVSKICLGTMTWGQQNSEGDAHAQMDMALSAGVNFWDTAEMYPSPPDKDKQGDTERFMGTWFNKTKQRNKVILASKISPMNFLRDGQTRFNAAHISAPSIAILSACRQTILIFISYTGLSVKPIILASSVILKRWQRSR